MYANKYTVWNKFCWSIILEVENIDWFKNVDNGLRFNHLDYLCISAHGYMILMICWEHTNNPTKPIQHVCIRFTKFKNMVFEKKINLKKISNTLIKEVREWLKRDELLESIVFEWHYKY